MIIWCIIIVITVINPAILSVIVNGIKHRTRKLEMRTSLLEGIVYATTGSYGVTVSAKDNTPYMGASKDMNVIVQGDEDYNKKEL